MTALSPAFALLAGDGEPLRFAGAQFLIKASAETTGGSFSILEEIDPLLTASDQAGEPPDEAYPRISEKYGITWL